jgi:hypothetical protein
MTCKMLVIHYLHIVFTHNIVISTEEKSPQVTPQLEKKSHFDE